MKKQKMTIGILCLCLVLLGGIWMWSGRQTKEGQSTAGTEETALLESETNQVAEVAVQNGSGGYCIRWEESKGVVEGLEELPLNQTQITKVRKCASSIQSREQIEGGETRLEEFGLKDAQTSVRITDQDGNESELKIGDAVPDAESERRYILWNGKVYVVDASGISAFLCKAEDFLSREVTPIYEDGILMKRVEFTGEAYEEEITVEHTQSEELAGYRVNSYKLVAPLEYPADAGAVEEYFPSLFGIEAEGIVSIRPETKELEAYGLTEPLQKAWVSYEDADSEEQEFGIAVSAPDEAGMVYVQREGLDLVYVCKAADLAWTEVTESMLVSHEILAPDIRELRSFSIETKEENATIELMDMNTEDAAAACKGQELKMENVRNFYYMLISMSADEVLLDGLPETKSMEQAAKVMFRYVDGSMKTVVFYRESARRLYAEVGNKERGGLLSETKLETVLNQFSHLTAGEEVKTRY